MRPAGKSRIGWHKAVPERPGIYWVRRRVPQHGRRDVPRFAGYRPLFGSHEIVGVLVVALGPRGGKRAFRWCDPVLHAVAKPAPDWEYRWAGRPWLDDGVLMDDDEQEARRGP